MIILQSLLQKMGVRTLDEIEYGIIHHSVLPKTFDITTINDFEVKEAGFIAVGYHAYTKCLDPVHDVWAVQQGRPLYAVPAAAFGMNVQSYDICIGGNYEDNVKNPDGSLVPTDVVSENALHAVAAQILLVKAKCKNLKYLIGHEDVAIIKESLGLNPGDYSTQCPGRHMYDRLPDLRKATGLINDPRVIEVHGQ